MIIVCGLMRSGTSLMMQMLHAAGVECLGEHPWYEDKRTAPYGVLDESLLKDAEGKAFKLLEPHARPIAHALPEDAVFVWMDRSYKEQATSYVKFLAFMDPSRKMKDLKRRYRSLKNGELQQSRQFGVQAIERYDRPIVKVRFEDIIKKPLYTAQGLETLLGLPEDSSIDMADVVLFRDTACSDRMLEAEL